MKAILLTVLLCLFTFIVAEAQSLPSAKPEQVGLSSERLNKITATLKADADKGVIPGAVLLVARHGKVALFEAVGVRNPETKAPMTKDSIFRIYSMSKPITSVAAMMLFEEGRFSLAEPVSKYIPQLGGLKVGVEKPDASGKPTLELVPAQRNMTIHDLFRHTSGLTYGFFGNSLVKKMYVETKVSKARLACSMLIFMSPRSASGISGFMNASLAMLLSCCGTCPLSCGGSSDGGGFESSPLWRAAFSMANSIVQ